MKLVICFNRYIWGCLPSSWPPFLSLLHRMVVSPGSCVCNTQLCSFVLVIGTEVDPRYHFNSSYFVSREFRIDSERQQPVSASHLNLRVKRHPSLAMVCEKIWSKGEDEFISDGHRHERMWHARDSNLGFQWISTCWLHWAHMSPSCTFPEFCPWTVIINFLYFILVCVGFCLHRIKEFYYAASQET